MKALLKNKFLILLKTILILYACRTTGWDRYELKNKPSTIEIISRSKFIPNSITEHTVTFSSNGRIKRETFFNIVQQDSSLRSDTLMRRVDDYYYGMRYKAKYLMRNTSKYGVGQKLKYKYPSCKRVIQKTNWESHNSIIEERWDDKRLVSRKSYSESNTSATLWEYNYNHNKNVSKTIIKNIHVPTDSCYATRTWYYDYLEFDELGNWTNRLLYELIPGKPSDENDIGFDTLKTYQKRIIVY